MKNKKIIFIGVIACIVIVFALAVAIIIGNNKEYEQVKNAVLKEGEANVIHIEKAENTGYNGDFYFVWVVDEDNRYAFKIVEITESEVIVRSYVELSRMPLFE